MENARDKHWRVGGEGDVSVRTADVACDRSMGDPAIAASVSSVGKTAAAAEELSRRDGRSGDLSR